MQTFLHYRWRVPSTLHRLHPRRIIPLLLLALCVTGAKAQTNVKFNGDIRYSKWVIDSRMNDFYANTTPCGFAVYDQSGTQTSARVDGKKELDYVVGLVAKSIIEASQYYSQYDWAKSFAKPWFLSIQDYGNYFYDKFRSTSGSLDDLNAVKLFLPLRELTAPNATYANSTTYANTASALNTALSGLRTHNTQYSIGSETLAKTAGKTVAGGWWHKSDYQDQMWLDGSYMGPALFAQLVNYSNKTTNIDATNDWDLIVKQFTILRNMCWNSDHKLLYHAFAADGGTNTTSHSDTWYGLSHTSPYCFHSATYWGRAVGWYFLALVDVLEQMQKANIASTDSKFTTLKGYLEEIAEGIKNRQDETTGGWYQILDEKSTYSASSYNNGKSHTTTYNYIESSATALFTAAYLKAIRLKYLTETDYKTVAENGYKCLVNNFFSVDANGKVNIFGSCRSAGLGGSGDSYIAGAEKYRNGSKEYYLLGSDVARVDKSENETEGKVLGAFIMAATEYEIANPKAIRFSYDLAPSYTLAQGGSIPVEALGSGTITYQWCNYSDDSAVSGATSKTFSPTASGTYYCKATSGSTTIKTSPTVVTVEAASKDIFSLTVTCNQKYNLASGADLVLTSEYATVTGGSALVHNGKKNSAVDIIYLKNSSSGNIALNGSGGTYAKLTLDTPLQEGDVITFTSDESSIGSFYLTTTSTRNENCSVTGGTYTVTSSDGLANSTELYVWSQLNGKFKSITITRGGSSTTTYTITYDLNGHGENYTADNATALPDPLPTPTADGYTFGGWYTDSNCTTAAIAGATISGNTTLYAKWTINKYTVTATAVNGSIDIKDGSNKITSGTQVEHGTPLTFTATANSGYEFSGWTVNDNPVAGNSNVYTIASLTGPTAVTANFTATSSGGGETGNVVTKTGTFPRSEMKYFDGNPDSKLGEVSSISKDAAGNTVTENPVLTLSSTSVNVQAQKNDNDKGTKVRTNGSFTITAASGYTIKSIELVTDQSSRNLTSSPDATPERNGTNYTYNFTKGEQSVTFINNSSGNIYVGVINVTYEFSAAEGKTPLTISFSESQKEGYVGETITLPTPTVTANGTAASSGVYNVTYKSNNETIATVSNEGQVTLKAAGTVAITAIVEPKAEYAGLYEGGSAVITVVSKAYTPLTVSVADVMMNSNDGAQTNPDVKVYLNNQLVASSNYTVSYEVTNGTNVTANGSALTVTGSAGNYTAGTSTIQVTVTPTADFASTNHCEAGTATFAYVVNQAGTKLQPVIDFPDVITLGTNVTNTLTSYVKYNGVDVTELFTKKYEITNAGSSSGASFTNAETGVFNTGTAEATVTIKITVTPLADYKDQYNGAEKTVTVNIKQLTELTITQPGNMTVQVGEVRDMPSFEIKEKTSGTAVSADDLKFVINSSSTSVVTVSDDKTKLYAVGAGTATIIVLATDNTGQSKYMDANTSFTVTVLDPTLHIVKNGATATNGQCITDVPGVYMTYGGWVFNPITTYLEKDFGAKQWNNAGSDDAGAPVGFPYAVKGNGHEDARDELGASAAPEGTTVDYQSKGFKLTDKMFSVPAEGAYFVFTPKVNGTVVAHVLQNGVFDPGYNSSTQQHTPTYKPNRRVFVMDESGTRMPDNQITPHLDVTTGTPKATKTESHKINNIDISFTENTKIDDVRAYKTDYENASGGKIYLSPTYDFDGGDGSVDGGIEGFKPTITDNKITFQNDIYKRKVNKGKDNVEGGYVVLSKAPVTYTFKVKAGKSYYLYCFGSKLSLYGYEFKADEAKTVDDVKLYEASSSSLSPTAEGHVAQVSLDRTFKSGIWNACVLPFSLNKYQVDAIFGQTYDKNNTEGTQILYFDRVEGSKIYFVRHAYNHIVAGKPFLIKPTKDARINTANILAFPYVTIEKTGTPADFGKGTDYKWASSYAPFTVSPGDYFLRDTEVNNKPADGNIVRYPATQTNGLNMKGFRGYIKAQSDAVRKSTKSMSIVIGSVDDDETTVIEDVVIDEDGTLRPALKGNVYNIQGQLMTTDASKLNTLPKGIYIVNGSKITVE